MDGVIVDFDSGIQSLSEQEFRDYRDNYPRCPGIFSKMIPMPDALDAVRELFELYDVYILSSPGWGNATAWSDKYDWIVKYLPFMKRRLILSSQKHLNIGDYIIDDRLHNGVSEFNGEHIHFGTSDFPGWRSVLDYLKSK